MDCLDLSGPVTFLVDTGTSISLLSLAEVRLVVERRRNILTLGW